MRQHKFTSRLSICFLTLHLAVANVAAQDARRNSTDPALQSAPVQFEKHILTSQYYCDGITAGDLNNDSHMDIVAGPFVYWGPTFETKIEIYPAIVLPTEPSPSNSMFSYVYDFSGDGWADVLVLGRVHMHQAFWYENPQDQTVPWKKHFAFERVQGESPPFTDVDKDGRPELVALWDSHWGLIQPDWKEPTSPWRFRPITSSGDWKRFFHGTGVGDIDGDGRNDLILNDGWWKQPDETPLTGRWRSNPYRFAERGGAQIGTYDVDGDGDNDIVTAIDAHGWGLSWFEQIERDGQATFVEHKIMGDRSEESSFGVAFSQPHALDFADIDGDGLTDVVVGKRRWAHGPTGDVEPMADPVVYWFRLIRESGSVRFEPHEIDDESGVGVQITAVDVNNDGRTDVLTASKLGTFLFLNVPGNRD